MNKMKMETRQVPIDDLMLDPNNPRFIKQFSNPKTYNDDEIDGCQASVLKQFKLGGTQVNPLGSETGEESDEDETGFFELDDLWNSMKDIGLVLIDRIVVRKLEHSNKYLVIEGNRRIATAKLLLQKDKVEPNPQKKLSTKIIDSLQSIEVLQLMTDGMNPEDIKHHVAIILGLRHHGSVLEWSALAKAYNTLKEYKGLDPVMEKFKFNNERAGDVAGRLSVKLSYVGKACMTYMVYEQLRERFPGVKPSHYSLIEAAVTRKVLTGSRGYFVVDLSTYEMDEPSLVLMDQLCQFEHRTQNKDNIIPDPRNFSHLAQLVRGRDAHPDESVKKHAAGLLIQVESAELKAEDAASNLKSFINKKSWSDALDKELDKQDKELDIEEFDPESMDFTFFKDVNDVYNVLRRALNL